MVTKKNLPRATLDVTSRHVYFRMASVPLRSFYRYLHFVRQQFPYMKWRKDIGMWQLPICDLKHLYELCRLLFGVDNVHFQFRKYRGNPRLMQLSLFDSEGV